MARAKSFSGGRRLAAANGRAIELESLEPRQLLAADPITPDNPFWVAMPGTATVDGVMGEAAWANAFTITRFQAFRSDSPAVVKFMYGPSGLYVGWDVRDTNLWSDGRGFGIALRYEVETDDSMTLYFDPNDSRDEFFQDSDRAFGVNLGNPEDPILAATPIKLVKYVKGDGAGGAPDVNPGGSLADGLVWRTVRHGTVNDDSDTDVGWTTEMFIPWAAIGLAPTGPVNGQTIGMNFDLIFDNSGGTRDLTDYRVANGGADEWTKPAFVDDHIQGAHSSYTATQAGLHGPINYAELMFLDPRAASKPAGITGLAAANVTGYSAELDFNAPAGVAGTAPSGHVSGYEIRYSTSAITTEADWVAATKFGNAYVPRLAGLAEKLKLIGLTPGTSYFAAVRGIDAAGNLGALSNSVGFTTQSTTEDPSGGLRLVPSPFGRTLVNENGVGFISVGDHLGLPWNYTRNLYPGDIWNASNGTFINFNTNPSYEGTAGPYLDQLQQRGINTMRVYLELQDVYFPPFNQLPRGTYWLEYGKIGHATQFNPAMRQFMLNVLREADARGMYIIFSPFHDYSYDEAFATEFPWSNFNGGPLTDINDFFQTPAVLDRAKARMDTVVGWVKSEEFKPYVRRLMGWEVLSEWDSYEWTLNAEGDAEPGRETEFRHRAQWVDNLAAYIKSIDPTRMTFQSSITQDPRGPTARLVFYSRNFDAQTPHFYTASNDEPLNNPDADRKVRAAVDNANLTQYWISHAETRRPIINGEWGMSRFNWPDGVVSYRPEFLQTEDEALFRTMIWSGLASGQFGTSFRIAAEELNFSTGTNRTQGYILTDAMRLAQKTFSTFVSSTTLALDYANFNFTSLAGRLSVTNTSGKALKSWGVSDRRQGILYLLQDGNLTTGTVAGGEVTITGLRPDSILDIEVWSTAAGASAPLITLGGRFVSTGSLTFSVPTFTEDVAIKFKARAGTGQAQRVTAIDSGTSLYSFYLDQGAQPVARVQNASTGAVTLVDLSAEARFTGRVVDMDPFTYAGRVYLAVTDENHHLWLFSQTITDDWSVEDLTASINAPGLTSDLTHYIPSWGTIQIAGLDARGHNVNYYFQPGVSTTWLFSDLTQDISGPTMAGGLTGFVTGWDGLNIAGLTADGQVIAYWWSLNSGGWQTINMTQAFSGPTLVGQLDAYVTPWGGLNITGLTATDELYTYWWAPGLSQWYVNSITQAAGAPFAAHGVEVAVSADGGINLFSTDSSDDLSVLRWTPADPVWRYTNISSAAGGQKVSLPLGAASVAQGLASNKLIVAARNAGASKALTVFTFDLTTWTSIDTGIAIEI